VALVLKRNRDVVVGFEGKKKKAKISLNMPDANYSFLQLNFCTSRIGVRLAAFVSSEN